MAAEARRNDADGFCVPLGGTVDGMVMAAEARRNDADGFCVPNH